MRNSVEKLGKIHSENAEKIAFKKPRAVFYIESRAYQKKIQKKFLWKTKKSRNAKSFLVTMYIFGGIFKNRAKISKLG